MDQDTNYGYKVPEKSILTGTVAKKIPIKGQLELSVGEIVASIGLLLILGVIVLLTLFMGWDILPIAIRIGLITMVGGFGKMVIFDRPGEMKYGDWLMLWYRYRSRKAAGQLDYVPTSQRRAYIHRRNRNPPAAGNQEQPGIIEVGPPAEEEQPRRSATLSAADGRALQ